jgi:hypothetical protein
MTGAATLLALEGKGQNASTPLNALKPLWTMTPKTSKINAFD